MKEIGIFELIDRFVTLNRLSSSSKKNSKLCEELEELEELEDIARKSCGNIELLVLKVQLLFRAMGSSHHHIFD